MLRRKIGKIGKDMETAKSLKDDVKRNMNSLQEEFHDLRMGVHEADALSKSELRRMREILNEEVKDLKSANK